MVNQWLKAGQYAAGRLAYVEAIAHLERGLALLGSLPETQARDAREIDLQLALGVSFITVKGMGSPSVPQAYGRARELAERRGDEHQLFQAIYGMWQNTVASGQILSARALSDRLLQVGRGADDGLRLQAHHSAWTTCLFAGEPAAAREHCNVGRQIYDPERHSLHRRLYGGHDPGVCARYMSGQAHWLLGYPQKGLVIGSDALALAEQIGHPFSQATALVRNALLHLERAEPVWHCNGSRRPRRSPSSNDYSWCSNRSFCAVPSCRHRGRWARLWSVCVRGLLAGPARFGCVRTV